MESKKILNTIRIIIMLLLVLGIFPLLPMLISAEWRWWQAWMMAIIFILGFIISRVLSARKTPDILKERANYNQHENTQAWDKWLSPLVAFGSIFILVTAGFDALYHWSPAFPLSMQIVGLILILAGYVLGSYALISNAYFSGTVRIQEERRHKVESGGPYAWVRHPGYLGSLISNLGMPLLLDSAWAFIPVLIVGTFFIIRTRLEDQFLKDNLTGYREYSENVRYRLFPGIW